jgi:type II secretory pathway pseudopilin PulG
VERKKTGLTVVELLIVIGIIAILVGLLIPALSAVKTMAKETKQKAQLGTIELALTAFKNDYGDFPPSSWTPAELTGDYCGAQKLAEALLGWDLMGFHPSSAWRSDGLDAEGGAGTYDPAQIRDNNGDGVPDTLNERKGPYLEMATVNAFKLGDLFLSGPLAANTYVMCDVFNWRKVVLPDGNTTLAGAPILYYRANTSRKLIREIYNVLDNDPLVQMKLDMDRKEHPLTRDDNQFEFFYEYIRDPKIEARAWPYRPDSYLLISAGVDGLYGTDDDIKNFGN